MEFILDGSQELDKALARAHAGAPEDWKSRARAALEGLIASGLPFTTDDVWAVLRHPPEPRALGALVMAYAKAGKICRKGFRPSQRPECHRRPIAVWIGKA